MWRIRLCAILLIFSCSTARTLHAGPRVSSSIAGLSYISLATWDAVLTVQCSESRQCHEANPLLKSLVETHGIRTAMTAKLGTNVAMTAGAWYVAHKWPHRRKTITTMLVSMAAVQGYVVYRNYKVIHR